MMHEKKWERILVDVFLGLLLVLLELAELGMVLEAIIFGSGPYFIKWY